ncbi:MAG TPA: 23S rRNA (guanosine(2251)-2'-O)-methyltransferase RlmB [Devosia sp.]|nr:23S rRNA (guanosine(2251)-2'-O)-methyltransferase RlmB [Devosia sp.]
MSINKFPPKPKYDPDTGPVYLYGLHTVRAALDNPRRLKRELLATPNGLARLREGGEIGKVAVRETTPKELDRLLGGEAVHQGVALEVDPVSRFGINDIPAPKLVVVLDQVTDPHNVGAILRTACAFGADAVLTTARYAPRETGVMAKAASGALDLVPLIEVRNLADALETLKQRGLTILGFDSDASAPLRPRQGGGPLAIVLGAEGKGLRQKTRSLCDEMVRLDMPGPIKSLNVSNAAAIALFAASPGIRPDFDAGP